MSVELSQPNHRVTLTVDDVSLTLGVIHISSLIKRYADEATLQAASPANGTIGFAISESSHWLRQNDDWGQVATTDYVDGLDSGDVQDTRQVIAGAGLTGGGDLSADRTIDVVANADGSIVVNANDIQVGILATDAQHGDLGGGSLHDEATTSTAGFLSADDKLKLDGVAIATQEALNFPIDPSSSFVPSADTVVKQADIAAILAAGGASAFKYPKDAYELLPTEIAHVVTFTFVAGTNRPRSSDTSTGWDFSTKKLVRAGQLVFQGATSGSYTPYGVLSAQVVQSHVAGSNDPSLTFSGTPFNGLDLRGSHAVLSSGQVAMIHDHTDSILYLCDNITPALTNGLSTCQVARPSTVWVNSADDVNRKASQWLATNTLTDEDLFPANRVTFNDILFKPFRASNGSLINGRINFTRCVWDRETVSSENGTNLALQNVTALTLTDCSYLNTPGSAGADAIISVTANCSVTLTKCYIKGSEDGIEIAGATSYLTLWSTVLDRVGSLADGNSVRIADGARMDMFSFSGSKYCEIRGQAVSTVCGIAIDNGALLRDDVRQECLFKNLAGPGIRLGARGSANVSAASTVSGGTAGLMDGGGNTNFGVVINGPYAYYKYESHSTLTGSLGDISLNGNTVAYSSLSAGDSYIDDLGNAVVRYA